EGAMTFQAPLKPGSWDFRMNQSGEEEGKELASATFQVVAVDYKTSIQLIKTSFTPGEEISITLSTARRLPKTAWLGVIPSNVQHGTSQMNDQHDVDYQYIND